MQSCDGFAACLRSPILHFISCYLWTRSREFGQKNLQKCMFVIFFCKSLAEAAKMSASKCPQALIVHYVACEEYQLVNAPWPIYYRGDAINLLAINN